MVGDLHTHSNCSDGSLNVEDLIGLAAKNGLNFLSITDHNYLNPRNEVLEISKKYGIELIYGVEISSFDVKRKRKVHILCYNPTDELVLEPICRKLVETRFKKGEIKKKFILENYNITDKLIEKYRSKSNILFDQNLTHALMECGYCDSIYGNIYKSLYSDSFNIESDEDFEVKYVLSLIHKAGGKAVLAHPGVYDSFDLLGELIGEKLLDGVEVWHPKNSKSETEFLLKLVKQNGLFPTGGTDFHGFYSSHRLVQIGSFTTPKESIDRILS